MTSLADQFQFGYNPQQSLLGGAAPQTDWFGGTSGMPALNMGSGGGAPAGGGFWDSLKNINWLNQYNSDGEQTGQGVLSPALGVAQGLLSAYMGMQQYGNQNKMLAESKRQFGLNFDAQKNTTNAQLEDRQKARVASNPGAYESVDSYMDKYKVKG